MALTRRKGRVNVIVKSVTDYIIHDCDRRLRVMPENWLVFWFKSRDATGLVMNNADYRVPSTIWGALTPWNNSLEKQKNKKNKKWSVLFWQRNTTELLSQAICRSKPTYFATPKASRQKGVLIKLKWYFFSSFQMKKKIATQPCEGLCVVQM